MQLDNLDFRLYHPYKEWVCNECNDRHKLFYDDEAKKELAKLILESYSFVDIDLYSGMNDSFNQKIYANDILECKSKNCKIYKGDRIGLVVCNEYFNFNFYTQAKEIKYSESLAFIKLNFNIKVIGNIYENKELLKVA